MRITKCHFALVVQVIIGRQRRIPSGFEENVCLQFAGHADYKMAFRFVGSSSLMGRLRVDMGIGVILMGTRCSRLEARWGAP